MKDIVKFNDRQSGRWSKKPWWSGRLKTMSKLELIDLLFEISAQKIVVEAHLRTLLSEKGTRKS